MADHQTENAQRLDDLLGYFRSHKLWEAFEVTKRYDFDQRATRFDFAKGVQHFMFDVPDKVVADNPLPAILKLLEDGNWWKVLQVSPAPYVVTISQQNGCLVSQQGLPPVTKGQRKNWAQ